MAQALTLDLPIDSQASLLKERTSWGDNVPGLRLNTVKHRQRIPTAAQIDFRVKLLRSIRQAWGDDNTEALFLKAVHQVENEGCALFGALIDPVLFAKLIEEYDKVQAKSGNNAFMHSYVNLAVEHEFFLGGTYIQAFSHPLLVAIISYLLGGSIRIVDFRGKNNDPIKINAQDNMLHVDNTPFKEEYKVLLNWRRGQVKGPSGQNFTFLPWTHKGNRDVRIDEEGAPWSTERDSLFVTDPAIDGLLDFQKIVGGESRVIEATNPEAPLAILFPAGALVHHRYRTEEGDPRSCIITAFHLSSEHPGQISELPPIVGRKKNLIEFLVGYQDKNSNEEFLELLGVESTTIQSKLRQLYEPSHPSKLIPLEPLALKGERLKKWREAVIGAPSPIKHKVLNNLRLAGLDLSNVESATETLAAVMDYDKHCNLQMVLYDDGREEIRKPSRKIVGEMRKNDITVRLRPWIQDVCSTPFSQKDLIEPKTLRVMCDAIASLARNIADGVVTGEEGVVGEKKLYLSLSRLMLDLGEAIVRCEGIEAFVVTGLFLFLTADQIYERLPEAEKLLFRHMLVVFLRNYVATVLIVEATQN